MIDQRAVQEWAVGLVTTANTGFKLVRRIGMYEIDLGDPASVAKYGKVSPACFIEMGNCSAMYLDAGGLQSMTEWEFYVWVFTRGGNDWTRTSDEADALSNTTVEALRGQLFTGDGYYGELRYQGRAVGRTEEGGLLLILQKYSFISNDK